MLYPMAQRVAHFCVETDKQMPLQGHRALSIVVIIIIIQNHFGARASI
jgi:hypothetical protein